ncbi:MAG: hypothetical protein R3C20_06385 [Planctomycetaceae bacterium]
MARVRIHDRRYANNVVVLLTYGCLLLMHDELPSMRQQDAGVEIER